MDEAIAEPGGWNKARIEALSDGVFAIAITLLVLEIKVPELERHIGAAVLWHAVRARWPLFFSFVITFGLTGVFWFWHHAAFHHMRRADGVIIFIDPKTPFVRRFSIGIRVQVVACVVTLVMIPINPQWCYNTFVLVQMPMGIIMRRRLRAEKRA